MMKTEDTGLQSKDEKAPRNCDLYKTESQARNAFYHEYFGPTEEEFVNLAFIKWLFQRKESHR